MSYIFMDESGDLGFNFKKTKTTRNSIITFLCVNNKRPIEKVIRKTFKILPDRVKKNHCGVLHAYKEKLLTNTKLLHNLVRCNNFKIMVIKLNKNKVYADLRNQPNFLYNYVTNILLDRILTKDLLEDPSTINFVASQKDANKFLNENFKAYIVKTINGKYSNFNIVIKKPSQEKALQVVDCLSWSIFRKHEYSDDTYYNIFKDFIVEESDLYK